MAVEKERLPVGAASGRKATATSRKPKRKTGGKATKRAGTKAPEVKPEEQNGAARECPDGEARLRESVHRAVAAKSQAIADGLAKMAAEGNPACTKLLMDLMAGKKVSAKNMERALTCAQTLEHDKPWEPSKEQETKDSVPCAVDGVQ